MKQSLKNLETFNKNNTKLQDILRHFKKNVKNNQQTRRNPQNNRDGRINKYNKIGIKIKSRF